MTRWPVLAVLLFAMSGCETSDPQPRSGPASILPSATQEPLESQPAASARSSQVAVAELLPVSLGGVELHTFPVGNDVLDRLATRLSIDRGTIDAAYASEHGARFFQSYALRAPGVEGPRLLKAFVASAYDPADGDVGREETAVGGRSVTVVSQPTTAARLGTFYAYLIDDVVIVVQAFDPAVAADVIAALP